jgi:hypothetical protein
MHSSAASPNLAVEITSDDISPDHDPHLSQAPPNDMYWAAAL